MYLCLPKRHKSVKENILAQLAIPAAVEGVITAAPQHGWSLGGDTGLGEYLRTGGAAEILPLFGFQNPQYLAFPMYSKIISQILQKLFCCFFF